MSETEYPAARDLSTRSDVPTPKGTIPKERLEQLVSHETSGSYSPQRVISPPMTIAVRQEHPGGGRAIRRR